MRLQVAEETYIDMPVGTLNNFVEMTITMSAH